MSFGVPVWLGSYAEGCLYNRRSGVWYEIPWPSCLRARVGQYGCTMLARAGVAKRQRRPFSAGCRSGVASSRRQLCSARGASYAVLQRSAAAGGGIRP
eukprot:1666186-Lingulodinium_polyedra.AAC.1